ncbi:MAG: hypothetical protein AABW67_01650, partial [Nanoarchaeota archaeon]
YETKFLKIQLLSALEELEKKVKSPRIEMYELPKNAQEIWCRDNLGEVFVYTEKEWKKRHKRSPSPQVRFENLMAINNNPAIIESSLARLPPLEQTKRKIEFFYENTRVFPNYLIWTLEQNLNFKNVQKYKTFGGKVAKIPVTRQQYREEVRKALEATNLKYKIPQHLPLY